MKIYKSNYRYHWVSPYTILKAVCFWEKDDDVFYNHEDTPGHKYDKWVARLEPICKAWMKFLDFVHPKINYVKIDRYDTWSMDHTLADIILPMLKQLKTTKHGSPSVDDQDVPEGLGLRSTEAGPKENEWDTDDNWFKRWDWVLDEMIFAFEHTIPGKMLFAQANLITKQLPANGTKMAKPPCTTGKMVQITHTNVTTKA
jgi:hypothetical protein